MALDPTSQVSFAQSFAAVATSGGRPKFEYAFSVFQNSIIDRLNKEILKARESAKDDITPEMFLRQQALYRKYPLVQRYDVDVTNNRYRASQILDNLVQLSTLSTAGDQAGFDALRATTEELAKNFAWADGTGIGIVVDDGFRDIAATGLSIGTYASYATDADRQSAINSADTKVRNALNIANINAEIVWDLRESVEEDISALAAEIDAARLAGEAERGNEIEKLRRSYGRLLEQLSLAFEVAQARSEKFAQTLLVPAEPAPDSPVNIIV